MNDASLNEINGYLSTAGAVGRAKREVAPVKGIAIRSEPMGQVPGLMTDHEFHEMD
jgi:hypothetical protein